MVIDNIMFDNFMFYPHQQHYLGTFKTQNDKISPLSFDSFFLNLKKEVLFLLLQSGNARARNTLLLADLLFMSLMYHKIRAE